MLESIALPKIGTRTRWIRLVAVALAPLIAGTGCSSSPTPGDTGSDAADVSTTDIAADNATDVHADVTPDTAAICGTTNCTGGQICCAQTMLCYDPTCLACCMEGVDAATDTGVDAVATDSSAHDAPAADNVVMDVTGDTGGGTCGAGGTCSAGLSCCTSECRNFQNDPLNCGSCGHACTGATSMCASGTCVVATCTPACSEGDSCCLVERGGPLGAPECDPGPSCPVGCPACL